MSVTGCGLGFGFGGGCGGGRGCGAPVLGIWNQRQENRGEDSRESGRGTWKQRGDGGLERRCGCAERPAIHSCVLIPPNTPLLSGL